MRKVTSQDVADAVGVSQATVSLILNGSEKIKFSEETRARVFAAAKKMGYKLPARKSRKRQTDAEPGKRKLLCVLTPTLSNYYYTELIQYAQVYAHTRGYHIIVCNTFREQALEKYYLDYFRHADGFLYTFLPGYPQMVEQMAETTPVVIIGEKHDDLRLCSIALCNHTAGVRIAEYLYSLGHRRFVFVSTPLKRFSLSREQRLEGIKAVLEGYGLRDAVQVLATASSAERESPEANISYEYETGRSMTLTALREGLNGATAFIGVNDMTALGAMDALKEHGLDIPGEISVCGFDNLLASTLTTPTLTTVDHQMQKRCQAAIDMLITMCESGTAGAPPVNATEYAPRLMVRASTGPAPDIPRA